MRNDIHKGRIFFTIFVFVALASLDHAVIGLFPPLFTSIAADLNIPISSLGVISAVSYLVISVSSVIWGYLADKGERKRLIIIGTILWSISVFSTAYSRTYLQLLLSQIVTGIGLGCIGSIGYSVLSDYIPYKWRGTLLSLWGMSQGFGGIAGSVMASVVASESNWRRPFEIIAALGLVFTIFYLFIKEPSKGASEPEINELAKEGFEYNYSIDLPQVARIIAKKSNLWLMFQGFFINVTTGTLIWLPTLYTSKIQALGYSQSTAIIASGYLFALFQLGGLSSMYFGYIGDRLQKRNDKGRALLGAASVFTAMPLYILMFSTPLHSLSIPDHSNAISILGGILQQLLFNPALLGMFLLAVGATAAQSANIPNWLALLTDVNLPEHRATAFSIANLIAGAGRALGNVLIGIVLSLSSYKLPEPYNYIVTMSIFQLFFLPAVFCYLKVARTGKRDIKQVKRTLRKRIRQY